MDWHCIEYMVRQVVSYIKRMAESVIFFCY
nr:MAG TPA: hypothetical protein [Caudoviricetes sp.]